ncbi:MAG: tryptophan synthase subunit alpha, partial [Burkholderiaceae bacterium]
AMVGQLATGYVYYVSLKGVTGAGHLDTDAVAAMLPRIRKHIHIPVGVGFGIRDAHTACAVGAQADAVVIGTKIIQIAQTSPKDEVGSHVRNFLSVIRIALNALGPR